jgi:hypothetical protein
VANKKSYNRYFIIFQEEDKGYGIAIDKQPTGYTKIETRNGKAKVTVYAQNLIKEKGPYMCYLIDATKNPAVLAKMGEVKVDDTGRGETWWEHKEDDVADTGVAVDRFNVACVAVEGEEFVSPLAGYIGKDKVLWKDKIVSKPRSAGNEEMTEVIPENKAVENVAEETDVKEEVIEEKVEVEELDEEAKKFKKYEKIIKDDKATRNAEENNKDNNKDNKEEVKPAKGASKPIVAGDVEANKEENKEGVKPAKGASKPIVAGDVEANKEENKEEVKPAKAASKPIVVKDAEPLKEGAKKPVQVPVAPQGLNLEPLAQTYYADDVKEYENLMRHDDRKEGKYAKDFHGLLAGFEEVPDLSDGANGYRWWKIPHGYDMPIKNNRLFPYYSAIYHLKMAYPFINYIKCYRGCGHYYFGLRYDNEGEVKHIVYGIEGKNSIQEQPYMGMTGFVKWVPMKDKDTGVWLMHYNPYSGSIMIPKKR